MTPTPRQPLPPAAALAAAPVAGRFVARCAALFAVRLAGLLATLVLAGCADMGRQTTQAHAVTLAQLDAGKAIHGALANGDGTGGAGQPVSWPAQQWWQALHDPQLNRLVVTALADNPGLRATQARVRQAQALAGVAQAATGPRVDASASADRELYSAHSTIPAPLAGNYAWKNTATLSGSYDLDLWGRNRDVLAAALDEAHLAAAEAQMAQLALQTAIVRTYIQLSLDYALGDSVAANLAQRQRILDITRQRRQAGLSSELDVANIETTLPAGRREHEQIGESIALLRNQLAALIGKGPGDGDAIARPTLTFREQPSDADAPLLPRELPAELLGHRPDIAAQRWRVEAASSRIAQAKAGFYPNINLAAFAGFQSLGFGHLLDSHAEVRGIAPAISLPIFDGGRLRAQLGSQNAGYDGAVEQYNAAVVQALSDVANAVTRIRSDGEQLQLTQRALVSARRAQDLADRAYRAGMTDALNVIAANLSLLNEERQAAQQASRRLDNFATLMAALGGAIKLDFP